MAELSKKKDKARLSKLLKEKARTRRIVIALLCFVGFCIAFMLGFAFRSQVSLMSSLGIPVGEESQLNVLTGKTKDLTNSKTSVKSVYNSISERIDEVEDILSENSFDTADLDELTKATITDMLKCTGDEYARYYSASEYAKLINDSKVNKYSGVGVLLNEMNGKCFIADVFEGSEADIKGVLSGDYVKSINGEDMTGKSATEVRSAVAAQAGKQIVANLVRPKSSYGDVGDEYSVTLQVSDVNVENVSSEVKDNVAYINIHQFNDETSNVLSTKVKELDTDDVNAFVVDVRNNPGGYLNGALDCASLFLTSGTLVTIQSVAGNADRTTEGQTVTTKPVVVLINNNTSSAAEVFASALHDNSRAVLVGQKTAGKGNVAATRELSFGGAVRYTAAYFFTPKGNEIDKNGVKPDIELTDINDLNYDSDTLTTAIGSAIAISSY